MIGRYTLTGFRFDLIPEDALGILARSNDDPLEFRYLNNSSDLYSITSKSSTEMILVQQNTAQHSVDTYLGAIVSNDRNVVYWVNNSKPLS